MSNLPPFPFSFLSPVPSGSFPVVPSTPFPVPSAIPSRYPIKGSKTLRYGATIGSVTNIPDALSWYWNIQEGASSTCQFYYGPDDEYKVLPLSDVNRQSLIEFCTQHIFSFYIHLPVCLNLANLSKPRNIKISQSVISKGVSVVKDLPASCVLHFGSLGSVETVSTSLNELHLANPRYNYPSVLIENSAGEGTKLGVNWDQYRRLFEGLDNPAGRIGICIDTQHAFGSGMAAWSNDRATEIMFEEASSICANGITLIHLNDSLVPFRSRKDRHWPLKQGEIFKRSDSSLPRLLELAYDFATDVVCESPAKATDVNRDMEILRAEAIRIEGR